MSKRFREIEKEGIDVRAPLDVAEKFRIEAIKQGRSVSSLGSEIIIRYLGLDPAKYGLGSETKQTA